VFRGIFVSLRRANGFISVKLLEFLILRCGTNGHEARTDDIGRLSSD